MKIENNVTDIINHIEQLKNNLSEKINSLPQNPNINVINKNCFTINVKNLSPDLVLSPIYYNFKKQYEFIVGIISKADIKNVPNILKEIIKPKKYDGNVFYSYKGQRLHPEVIKYLKEII